MSDLDTRAATLRPDARDERDRRCCDSHQRADSCPELARPGACRRVDARGGDGDRPTGRWCDIGRGTEESAVDDERPDRPVSTSVSAPGTGSGSGSRRAALGRRGEELAARWLERRGLAIVDRNWRCARGEIDIVARDGDVLAFIEVKTRSGHGAGHPLEAVTARKLGRLRRLVPAWFREHPEHSAPEIRIDCLAVTVIDEHVGIDHVVGVA